MNKGVAYIVIPALFMVLGFGCNTINPVVIEERVPEAVEGRTAQKTDVIGPWLAQEGSVFESIIIDGGGEYVTHMLEKPFDEGIWVWDDATSQLRLTSNSNENLSLTFSNMAVQDGVLYLTDQDEVVHVWWFVDVDHE